MRPNFGAEWAGSDTRCLRFARWVAPQDARLASGCWPDSAGWALCPTGFLRKVSSMRLTSLSPFPRLTLAQARCGPPDRSRQGSLSRNFGVGPGSAAARLRLSSAALSWFTRAQPTSAGLSYFPITLVRQHWATVLDRCEVNVASIGRARCVLTPLTNHGSQSVLGRANTCTEASCSGMSIDACLAARRLLR